jgi:hypothetical protein
MCAATRRVGGTVRRFNVRNTVFNPTERRRQISPVVDARYFPLMLAVSPGRRNFFNRLRSGSALDFVSDWHSAGLPVCA